MEAQTIFCSPLFSRSCPLILPPPYLSILSPALVSIYQGARAPSLSLNLVASLLHALYLPLPAYSFFRSSHRCFFLADFLSRFLLTVLRRFPRKIMRSQR